MRSWIHDPLWVLASFGAVSALLALARLTRSWSPDARRKLLHMGFGAWVLFVTPRFRQLAWALVPPLVFAAVNASRRLQDAFPDLASDRPAARGLWTFPLGIALAYVCFWQEPARAAIAAGVAALTFADPAAVWIGQRWGQRRYRGAGSGRSLEGSIAFFLVAAVAAGVIAATHAVGFAPLRLAVVCGAVGAATEALTPSGWDNLTIPLATAAAFHWFA